MSKKNTPQWIDAKTKTYKKNYDTPLPFLNKSIKETSLDEFVDLMSNPPNKKTCDELYDWFCEIGWPEGYRYCIFSPSYSRITGYGCIMKSVDINK